MFTVYCSTHAGRVLLGPDDIESLISRTDGTDLHWVCSCGQRGVVHYHPASVPVGA